MDETTAEIRRLRTKAADQLANGGEVEGSFRAHQVPLSETRTNDAHRAQPAEWMRSYRPEELFDDGGTPRAEIAAFAPHGAKRMSATPHANGGELLRDLRLPDFTAFGVDVPQPGSGPVGATAVLGSRLAEVVRRNPHDFRIMGPDETASHRLQDVFEATARQFTGEIREGDDHTARAGRVLEVLDEHVLNKKSEIVRVYLPPDANTLRSTYDHCLRTRDCVNVRLRCRRRTRLHGEDAPDVRDWVRSA